MTHRQTATVSISVNGGLPNTSDDNITYDSIVVLENTDRVNIEEYTWEIISKPPGSTSVLSSKSWRLLTDGGSYATVETNATISSLTEVVLPILANSVTSVKVPGDPTNYFGPTSFLYSDHLTVKNLSLPGGTTEVLVVYTPQNPATSFTADAYGTFIVELTLNRQIKGRIGTSVRSPYLNMRLPGTDERGEFSGGWGKALYNALTSLEDGYATVAAATGSGAVSGDLSGSLPDPTVSGIQGRGVVSTAPTSGQALAWNGSAWEPTTISLSGQVASGDLSGTYPSPTVAKIQGRSVDSAAPSATDVLAWDGVKWTPTAPGAPGAHATTHQSGGADQISVAGLSGVLVTAQNADKLQSRSVLSTAPASGQVLAYNGSAWAPATPTGGSHTVGGSLHIADTLAAFNTKISDQNILGTLTAFGGDVSGTYSALSVIKLQGRDVDSTAPALSEVLTWDGSKWSPQAGGGPPSGAASGDLGGTYPSPDVVAIQGYDVATNAPSAGDVLVWNGETNKYYPEPQSGGGVGHYLVFSDDTEFTEAGTSSLTKKTFRLVIPSGRANDQWLAVISLWTTSGTDTAECIVRVGDGVSTWDSTTFTTTNSSETVIQQLINVNDPPETPGDILVVEFNLRVTTGTDTAHLKYTDLYAIFN